MGGLSKDSQRELGNLNVFDLQCGQRDTLQVKNLARLDIENEMRRVVTTYCEKMT
jgi:hypothetical protein